MFLLLILPRPLPWDGAAHIQGGASLLSYTSGNPHRQSRVHLLGDSHPCHGVEQHLASPSLVHDKTRVVLASVWSGTWLRVLAAYWLQWSWLPIHSSIQLLHKTRLIIPNQFHHCLFSSGRTLSTKILEGEEIATRATEAMKAQTSLWEVEMHCFDGDGASAVCPQPEVCL